MSDDAKEKVSEEHLNSGEYFGYVRDAYVSSVIASSLLDLSIYTQLYFSLDFISCIQPIRQMTKKAKKKMTAREQKTSFKKSGLHIQFIDCKLYNGRDYEQIPQHNLYQE
ncbi:hypothetical protein CW706_02020 [Candidatus Bathyarchaeota archaeon]|nr:MAG: hypothetical protein CW706_02020 [Candidatus Bathyarchaeota archaeon]